MAVGSYDTSGPAEQGYTLAEAWNGKTWTVKATPEPDNDSALNSISCRSARACVATGFAIQNNGNNWFSEVWNGRIWTVKTSPRPNGTTYSSIRGVSCASVGVCIAVGYYDVDSLAKSRTLAETWDGEIWEIDTTPNPRDGANGSDLNGVSCSSVNACVAVGGYSPPLQLRRSELGRDLERQNLGY